MSLKALSSQYNNPGYISELSSKCLRKVKPPPKGRLLLARKVSKMSLEELQAIPEVSRIKLVREAFQEKLMESQKPKAHQGFQKNVAPFKNHMEGFIDVNTQAFKALNTQIKKQVNHELLNIQYNLDDSTVVAQKRARKLNPDDEAACQTAINESIMLRAKQVLTETKHQVIDSPKVKRPKPILKKLLNLQFNQLHNSATQNP